MFGDALLSDMLTRLPFVTSTETLYTELPSPFDVVAKITVVGDTVGADELQATPVMVETRRLLTTILLTGTPPERRPPIPCAVKTLRSFVVEEFV